MGRHAALWQSIVGMRADRDPGDEDDHDVLRLPSAVPMFVEALRAGLRANLARRDRQIAIAQAELARRMNTMPPDIW